ncbi:hypothetical protein LOTGIDRAFT_153439 [Lottia gigantea]|uniref:Uncharacterized protein n=1 Tax=Lottia gigantea TaxID=225164 RepID=V4AFQ6_LOTGI|nr:hypothetical protein LOTGIDRAFT_153439 [Lottia gigantea]ESO93960.1 hypothetical protein LOTGIDRAFT_153439 [Lottia gigantea]
MDVTIWTQGKNLGDQKKPEGMRGCRFLGRRNGIRRYLIIVTILVVMVMGGIKIGSRDDDFRLLQENRVNQEVVMFNEDNPKVDIQKGDENVDVGLEDKVDLGKGSPTYDSEEDEYYVESKEHKTDPVQLDLQDDSVKQQQQDNEFKIQQLHQNSQNKFAVHTFANFGDSKDTKNHEQFDQNIVSEDQKDRNQIQIKQNNNHSLKEETDKAKAVLSFHPESYYDSEEEDVNDIQEGNDNEKTTMPAITKVITFSQYDSEEDTDDVQLNSLSNVDRIDNKVVSNINAEIAIDVDVANAHLPLIVPNIVHFVWFGDNTMTFNQMLSILSVHHFVKPEHIYYHCDSHPKGEWWQRVISIVVNIKVDIMSPPNEIFGFRIFTAKQQADVAKLQTLMTHGGIYLDTDVIVTKSLQPLRSYEFSIGYSQPGRFDSDIVISTHTSKFLQKWLVAYTQYSSAGGDDFFSCVAPYKLYKQYPDQVHVVNKMSTPTAKNVYSLYNGDLDWTNHYAVHLWRRLHDQVDNLDTIKDLDTPYGKLVKFIYNKV